MMGDGEPNSKAPSITHGGVVTFLLWSLYQYLCEPYDYHRSINNSKKQNLLLSSVRTAN